MLHRTEEHFSPGFRPIEPKRSPFRPDHMGAGAFSHKGSVLSVDQSPSRQPPHFYFGIDLHAVGFDWTGRLDQLTKGRTGRLDGELCPSSDLLSQRVQIGHNRKNGPQR